MFHIFKKEASPSQLFTRVPTVKDPRKSLRQTAVRLILVTQLLAELVYLLRLAASHWERVAPPPPHSPPCLASLQLVQVMEEMTVAQQPEASVEKDSAERNFSTQTEDDWAPNRVPASMDPVLLQPGLGVTTTTITTISQTGGDWSTGLFGVCGDKKTCVLGALVPCCLDLSLAHQYGECLCMPLLPGSTFAIRVGIRERYKIRGSVCEDWTAVYCCYPLAVCQMIREMKRRMKNQTYHVTTELERSGTTC